MEKILYLSLLAWASWATASAVDPLREAPSTGEEWVSVSRGLSFQPSSYLRNDKSLWDRVLESTWKSRPAQPYADSQETYYAAYSQAWRYVGYYIDCKNYEEQDDRHRRSMKNNDKNNYNVNYYNDGNNQNQENQNVQPCRRYLLWAAYVDPNYQGGGLGEYMIYNHYKQKWDETACNTMQGERCVKMDCHLPDTEFQLLGFFKQDDPNDWYEQLFKHEGYCVWKENDYEYMKEMADQWPEQCTLIGYLDDGTVVYYDVKPLGSGNVTIGLYTDNRCTQEYDVQDKIRDTIMANANIAMKESYIEEWNAAMEIFKICQPCKAYNLNNANYNNRDLEGDDYNYNNDPNKGRFKCKDDAGYTNVNQCYKFQSKTDMQYASLRDLTQASEQGSVHEISVGSTIYSSEVVPDKPNVTLFFMSLLIFVIGLWALNKTTDIMHCQPLRRNNTDMDVQLVASGRGSMS